VQAQAQAQVQSQVQSQVQVLAQRVERLLALPRDLSSHAWRPGPFAHFDAHEPKRRLIYVEVFPGDELLALCRPRRLPSCVVSRGARTVVWRRSGRPGI